MPVSDFFPTRQFLSGGARILTTLWVGGLWVVGYVATPVLFANLDDRILAGRLAGEMFNAIHAVGYLCGTLLLAGAIYQYGRHTLQAWHVWVVLGMLGLIIVIQFGIRPGMLELKQQGFSATAQFARLHGASSICYLLASLLGLLLVMRDGAARPLRPEA